MGYQEFMISELTRIIPDFDINNQRFLFKPPVYKGFTFIFRNIIRNNIMIDTRILGEFTNEAFDANRDLLELIFANMNIHIFQPFEELSEDNYSHLLDLLRRCKRIILVIKNTLNFIPQWMREIDICTIRGRYNSCLKPRILDLRVIPYRPIHGVRFLKHAYHDIDCKNLFPDLVCCVTCYNTVHRPEIALSDNLKYIEFDPAVITGISETGRARIDTDILDKALDAYDRLHFRGNRTKKALI